MFSSIFKKIIMSLSGAVLGLFLIVHALGNSTSFFGKETFLSYASHLHSLGPLITAFELGMLIVLIIHVLFATILYLENFKARPDNYYLKKSSGGQTIGSRTMPYTGLIILMFIIYHLKGFHFIEHDVPITEIILANLQNRFIAGIYIFSLIAVTIHVSHGFWSFLQTLGVNHPKYDVLVKKIPLGISLIIGLIFIAIPLLALSCNQFLR